MIDLSTCILLITIVIITHISPPVLDIVCPSLWTLLFSFSFSECQVCLPIPANSMVQTAVWKPSTHLFVNQTQMKGRWFDDCRPPASRTPLPLPRQGGFGGLRLPLPFLPGRLAFVENELGSPSHPRFPSPPKAEGPALPLDLIGTICLAHSSPFQAILRGANGDHVRVTLKLPPLLLRRFSFPN